MPSLPEVIKERRKSDPEFAERTRSYVKKYRENNLEKERERDRLNKAKKRSESREANNAYMREWNAKNKERINEAKRERLKNDSEYAEKVRLREREKHRANPEKTRNTALKSMYGITLDDYNKMYDAQDGKCAICEKDRKRGGHDGLVVDHCHSSKKVRKLLCSQCNQGIGKFKEDVTILKKAIQYVESFDKLKE